MYEYILSAKLATMLVAIAASMVGSAAVGSPRLWWRGLMLNFAPVIAVAFYIVAPFAPAPPHGLDLASGLLFEAAILLVFFRLLKALTTSMARSREAEAMAFLRVTSVMQLLLAIPVIGSEGFGIFSGGSRLDYLYEGASAKYFTYASILVSLVQAAFLAHRISARGNPGWLGGAIMLTSFGLSIVSGSKGGSFLWIVSALALVDYRRARIRTRVVVATIAAGCVALLVTANVIAGFLDITIDEFFELSVSRFFLTNDARALAFDLRNSLTSNVGVLPESFRSLATLFGSPPANPPLGVELFGALFGELSGNGANGSLMALIEYYVPAGYALAPVLVAVVGVALLYIGFRAIRRALIRPSSRVVVSVLALFSISQLSQDFLAFQVVMPLVCLSIIALWIYDQRHAKPSSRHQPRARSTNLVAADHHHHPGV